MHVLIDVKTLNNTSRWQMGFKGLNGFRPIWTLVDITTNFPNSHPAPLNSSFLLDQSVANVLIFLEILVQEIHFMP
jgi:hypothetical protein